MATGKRRMKEESVLTENHNETDTVMDEQHLGTSSSNGPDTDVSVVYVKTESMQDDAWWNVTASSDLELDRKTGLAETCAPEFEKKTVQPALAIDTSSAGAAALEQEDGELHNESKPVHPVLMYRNVYAADSTAVENGRHTAAKKSGESKPRGHDKHDQTTPRSTRSSTKSPNGVKVLTKNGRAGRRTGYSLRSKCPTFADKPKRRQETGSKARSEEQSYKCPDCPKSFANAHGLKFHRTVHTGETPYKCTECPLAFRTWQQRKTHYKAHKLEKLKPFRCTQCPLAFKRAMTLENHTKKHAYTGKKYQCDDCPLFFITHASLKFHRAIHTGEKPYRCHSCKMAFRTHRQLEWHSEIHPVEKEHKCSQCSASFTTSFGLKIHSRTHAGDRPHKCSECTSTFEFSYELKAHSRTHPGKNPFKCSECDAVFRYLTDLKEHYKSHPVEELHRCPQCPAAFLHSHQLQAHSAMHQRNPYGRLGYSSEPSKSPASVSAPSPASKTSGQRTKKRCKGQKRK
ncbi:hypothetical protein BaRGS_00014312 [Batillaria attramentaria]|uniref:C2H2-type domain-containing protein n=1 Tax=Batillaria attramentaria TaxID=370345 RepID=A0ABD0L4P1_9CAEN